MFVAENGLGRQPYTCTLDRPVYLRARLVSLYCMASGNNSTGLNDYHLLAPPAPQDPPELPDPPAPQDPPEPPAPEDPLELPEPPAPQEP